MFDEIKELFRAHINRMFFGDNEIQCVSESALDISDPENTVIEVTVKDAEGNKRKFKITEVKES